MHLNEKIQRNGKALLECAVCDKRQPVAANDKSLQTKRSTGDIQPDLHSKEETNFG
jgi:hypothetical protein